MDILLATNILLALSILPLFLVAGICFCKKDCNTLSQTLFISSGFFLIISTFFSTYGLQNEHSFFFDLFAVDHTKEIFLSIIGVGTILTSIFAIDYLPKYKDSISVNSVNLTTAIFVLGLIGVVWSNTPLVFLASWELMSVAGYFLVIANRKKESLSAGLWYFVMAQFGFICIVSAFAIMTAGDLSAWAPEYSQTGLSGMKTTVAFLLLLIGFGSKAGLIPFHEWLPRAHPVALSHSSALLSGVMLSVAFFGFFFNVGWLDESLINPYAFLFAILIGAITAIFGSIYASVSDDAKKLLAWSSVENMGLLFMVASAFIASLALNIANAFLYFGLVFFILFHITNHFLFKTGLFLSIGGIASEAHTQNLNQLGGIAKALPAFSFATLILSLSAGALPITGTFIGEFILLQSLPMNIMNIEPAYIFVGTIILIAFAISAGLALSASLKAFSIIFLGRARTENAEKVVKMPLFMSLAVKICATLSILMLPVGLFVIAQSKNIDHYEVPFIALILFIVAFYFLINHFRKNSRVTETWDCGQPLTARTQYSATGFSGPLHFFFRPFISSTKKIIDEKIIETNDWIIKRKIEWIMYSIFEKTMFSISIAADKTFHLVAKMQNGVVQTYILYIFIALIFALLLI